MIKTVSDGWQRFILILVRHMLRSGVCGKKLDARFLDGAAAALDLTKEEISGACEQAYAAVEQLKYPESVQVAWQENFSGVPPQSVPPDGVRMVCACIAEASVRLKGGNLAEIVHDVGLDKETLRHLTASLRSTLPEIIRRARYEEAQRLFAQYPGLSRTEAARRAGFRNIEGLRHAERSWGKLVSS